MSHATSNLHPHTYDLLDSEISTIELHQLSIVTGGVGIIRPKPDPNSPVKPSRLVNAYAQAALWGGVGALGGGPLGFVGGVVGGFAGSLISDALP